MSVYEYAKSMIFIHADPFGLASCLFDSISESIKKCLASPTLEARVLCLEALINSLPESILKGRLKLIYDRVKKLQNANLTREECDKLHLRYKVLDEWCGSCAKSMSCKELLLRASCHGTVASLRSAWYLLCELQGKAAAPGKRDHATPITDRANAAARCVKFAAKKMSRRGGLG